VPLAGHGLRPTPLRRRAGRPQLKRDPLGGALPPHKHPFVNSVGTVRYAARRAPMLPKGHRFAAPHTPRPRYGVPRRARPSVGWLPRVKFSSQRWARAPCGARRARASVKSAPS